VSDSDVFDLIVGSGGATARFPAIGTTVEGVVLRTLKQQATEFKTNKPKFWPSGDPIIEAVFVLQTDERDPDAEDDDGVRRLYVSSRGQRDAVSAALRDAGVKRGDPLAGGTLKIQYVGDGEPASSGVSAPKIYRAKFTPPPRVNPAPSEYFDPDEEPF